MPPLPLFADADAAALPPPPRLSHHHRHLPNQQQHSIRCPPLPRGSRSFSEAFDLVLVLDTREQYEGGRGGAGAASARTDAALAALAAAGTRVEKRQLPAGDALWLARPKPRGGQGQPGGREEEAGQQQGDEFVLDVVVERKRADDLCNSVRSGRLARQAAALKACGLRRVALLVEGDARALCAGSFLGGGGRGGGGGANAPSPPRSHSFSASAPARAAKMVASASHSAEVHDGFLVLRAPGGAPDSFRLYAALTRELERALCACSPGSPAAALPPTYREFCSAVAANKERTVSEAWGLMLTALPGVGAAAAGALSARWPTPALLWRAMRGEAERAAAPPRSVSSSSSGDGAAAAAAASRALARAAVVSMLAAVPRAVSNGGGASGAPAAAAAAAATLGRAAAAAAVDALTDGGSALLPPRSPSPSSPFGFMATI